MKAGRTLTEMAQELDRQQKSKRDFVVTTDALGFSTDQNALTIGTPADDNVFGITDHTHRQIGSYTEIPAKYYDRMRVQAPQLLDQNVNHWFQDKPGRRMVRALDGRARAFLSDRYQRIDNFDIAQVALPALQAVGDIRIVSCEVTERRMYIKAVTPRVRGQLKVGDEVQAGVVISNSEIGQGAVSVEPLIYRLVCLNGMITGKSLRRNHVGRRADTGDDFYELLQDDTRKADDQALLLKVRDVVAASMDEAVFKREVERFAATAENRIEGNPVKVVEELANRMVLNEAEQTNVLTHLIRGGDLNQFGVINAVTRAAQDVEDYDRATEMEALGGRILNLDRSAWRELAEAA